MNRSVRNQKSDLCTISHMCYAMALSTASCINIPLSLSKLNSNPPSSLCLSHAKPTTKGSCNYLAVPRNAHTGAHNACTFCVYPCPVSPFCALIPYYLCVGFLTVKDLASSFCHRGMWYEARSSLFIKTPYSIPYINIFHERRYSL